MELGLDVAGNWDLNKSNKYLALSFYQLCLIRGGIIHRPAVFSGW